jgi:AcrR family transcriptional regulator
MTETTPAGDTREKILRAAEQLLAARGIEGVSLREINRAAAQSNTGAVQYHFGDRDGLVRAVIGRHQRDTEPRRHALLDNYETGGGDLRALAAALVLPLAAKLNDPDGGRAYLRIVAEFYNRPVPFDEIVPTRDPNSSMVRWHLLLDPLLQIEQDTVLRTRFAAVRFTLVELARRAAEPPHRDDRLYISHLIDLVTAVLAAEPSAPTTHLLSLRPPPSNDD